ncbi:unnamed protein product [Boreogadus saida]
MSYSLHRKIVGPGSWEIPVRPSAFALSTVLPFVAKGVVLATVVAVLPHDGATVFNIISEISLYLDSFPQVEERLCCCFLALGEMLELEEWIQVQLATIFTLIRVPNVMAVK